MSPTGCCGTLCWAACSGHESCIRKLLATGVDPNAANASTTPLHYASAHGHAECVRMLIAAGANPNIADNDGFTSLCWAAFNSHESCIRELLAAGADPNVVTVIGYTPLHWTSWNGHEACVAALISAGSDPNVAGGGRTPLQLAVEKSHKECAKILAVCILADRFLTDDEWDLIPTDFDIGSMLPVVMTRDGRDAAAKLVARMPKEKQKVLGTAVMCLSRFVSRDVAEQILVRCV